MFMDCLSHIHSHQNDKTIGSYIAPYNQLLLCISKEIGGIFLIHYKS